MNNNKIICDLIKGDCEEYLRDTQYKFDLIFLDPPFNQGKE